MDRRNLLKVGSGLLFGCATREVMRSDGMNRPVLRTKLCDVLGIEYPLVQAGMGGVAGWEMAAEVSRAGALGSFSAAGQTVEGVKEMMKSEEIGWPPASAIPTTSAPIPPAAKTGAGLTRSRSRATSR